MNVHQRQYLRFLRGVATGLLFLQLNLLWTSALHHHDQDDPVVGSSRAALSSAQEHPSQNASSLAPCPVCQIVRLSAVRPAAAYQTPKPARCRYFNPVLQAILPYSHRPAVVYGRAPPLT